LLAAADAYNTRNPSAPVSLAANASRRALVIAISGELDSASAPGFLEFAKSALPVAKERGGLVIDLKGVNYISSMGAGALTFLLAETHKASLPFSLSRVAPCVESVLSVLGFMSFFTIADLGADP
jgi:Anti-anti-sigma regulatory factor (antagonist of anti-sigma factor)